MGSWIDAAKESGGTVVNEVTNVTRNVTEVTEVRVPDWIQNNSALQRLGALSAGAAGTLVAFAEGPREYILGIVAEWIVGMFITAGEQLNGQLAAAWDPIASIPGSIARPLIGSGETVMSALGGAIGTVDTAVESAVASAGIFAPLVTTVIWAVAIVGGLFLLRFLVYRGIPLLVQFILWVVPWA